MKLQKAERSQSKIKIGLQGPSGSGKSLSALLMAYGLTNDWSKIAVIDTENNSASLYSHLGSFNVLNFKAPFSPERYIEAIQVCQNSNMEVIILDSVTMEWEYILDQHSQLTGNSYTNWAKFTPRHQRFIQAIVQAATHIICTIRSKQDYVLNEKNGKFIPQKVGMKGIQRDGVDYELTLVFEIDLHHNALATKDRTGLFADKPEFKLSSQTGATILNWCKAGKKVMEDIKEQIYQTSTIKELLELYNNVSPEIQQKFKIEFNQRKLTLQSPINNLKYSKNGINKH